LRNIDKLTQVQAQVREVAAMMSENIDKVMERVEQLDALVEKSQTLKQNQLKFEESAQLLKKRMRFQCRKVRAALCLSGACSKLAALQLFLCIQVPPIAAINLLAASCPSQI
jgi:hypothetical protein